MSNQSYKQQSVRDVTGTALNYEGDWHALFDDAGIPVGDFNGRLLAWINDYLGSTYTELNGAMQAFAVDQGYSDWDSMGTFDAGAVAPFTPASISGMVFWYDASDTATITSSGGLVSQWNDKSVNGYHMGQATALRQPTTGVRTVNGLNALDFNGANTMAAGGLGIETITAGPNTLYIVYVTDLLTTSQALLLGYNGGSDRWGIQHQNGNQRGQNSGNMTTTRTAVAGANITYLLRSGTSLTLNYNTTTNTTTVAADILLPNAIELGSNRFGGGIEYLDGAVCEVVAYNNANSPAEQASMVAYLKAKWGTP